MSSSASSSPGFDHLDLDHPAAAEGIVVDGLGGVGEVFIDGDDFAGDGRIEVGDGFDAFDLAELLARLKHAAHFGGQHERHVAQFFFGMFGDADGGDVALDARPFVCLRVLQILPVQP